MGSEEVLKNCTLKMKKAFDVFNHDLSSLRTGRANASMLDIIKVNVYGQSMSVNQLATISTPEARLLTVQVWDQNNVSLIDSAIKKSNLGINPQTEGQLIRLPIPKLSEERRIELTKIVSQYGENSKVAIRNNRRDFMDQAKKDEKEKSISQDDLKKLSNEIQKITDEYILKIEKIVFLK